MTDGAKIGRGGRLAMIRVILRTMPPTVLLVAAVASIIHGAKFHHTPVCEEQEIEVPIAPPEPFASGAFPGQDPFGGGPEDPSFGGPPAMGLPPELMNVKQTVIVTEDETEPTLVWEVTIGGVTLLASGDIKRTYTGDPPSLCPT